MSAVHRTMYLLPLGDEPNRDVEYGRAAAQREMRQGACGQVAGAGSTRIGVDPRDAVRVTGET